MTLGIVLVGFVSLPVIEAFILTLSSVCLQFADELSQPRESDVIWNAEGHAIIFSRASQFFSCQLLSSAINTGFCRQHTLASCPFSILFLSVLFMVRFFSFFFSTQVVISCSPRFFSFHCCLDPTHPPTHRVLFPVTDCRVHQPLSNCKSSHLFPVFLC